MATKPIQACPSDNPRATFESALALMQEGNGDRKPQATIAARQRPLVPATDHQAAEKRALTDAARALAQLWKVSPHLVR
jgi:hypothetical protein